MSEGSSEFHPKSPSKGEREQAESFSDADHGDSGSSCYEPLLTDEESSALSRNIERQNSEDFSGSDCELSESEFGKTTISQDPRMKIYDDMTDVQRSCLNFAMEHRIFLKAILGLLAERDNKATEIGMNDPNILKSGPLKKASHLVSGVWKIKYVELRRGMLSYHEDAGGLLRKNLPLDANTCSCRPVKIFRNGLNMAAGGAIFELKIDNTRRLWSAKSRAERLAWIQAINDAMVGGSVTQGKVKEQHGKSGTVNKRSPFQKDLKQYLKTKTALTRATTKSDYVTAIHELVGPPREIPVQWLMEQVEMPEDGGGAFHEAEMSSGVEQLFRDLLRDTLQINGELFHGDSGHGPEKMIASLSRNIVSFSRSSTSNTTAKYAIPESRAIAYARDILLSVNRTRSGGDSYFCIDTLCKNPSLIVTVPSSREAEPLAISVEVDDSEDPTNYSLYDKFGWVRTRNRIQVSWRKRFFVLSEGILSLYRNASPRPHGLRGQTVVTGATITVSKSKDHPRDFAIYIETKDGLKDRWLYFTNRFKLLQWAYALELTSRGTQIPHAIGRAGLRISKTETSSLSEEQEVVEQTMRSHAAQIGVGSEEFDERVARYSAKNDSRVKVSVSAVSEYNICTTDPQGDGSDEWATLRASFLQTFRISGDRIARGEEVVRVEVTTCLDPSNLSGAESVVAPTTPRKKLGLRPRLTTS